MADDVAGSAEAGSAKDGTRRKNLMMVGVLLGVMLAEGLAVFVLAKKFGAQPATAQAGGIGKLDPSEGEQAVGEAELELARFRAQNEKARQLLVYDLIVYATVAKPDLPQLQALAEQKSATIRDRFSSIVRSADPRVLNEPDLATLRQQFLQELKKISGNEELIRGVLIPSIVSYRED